MIAAEDCALLRVYLLSAQALHISSVTGADITGLSKRFGL